MRPVPADTRPTDVRGLLVIVTNLASDAHTWNLIYLQLLLEELGHRVANLGACVSDDLMVGECRSLLPDLIVMSTLNGHGHRDGPRAVARLRACPELRDTPIVIGGNLDISGQENTETSYALLAAGFDRVFHGTAGVLPFVKYLGSLRAVHPSALPAVAS